MQQKATAPIIVIAVVVLIGICALLYKQFAAPPSAGDSKTSPLPSFIDPVTHKPKAGIRGSSEGARGGLPPGAPPSGPGAGGGAPAGGSSGG